MGVSVSRLITTAKIRERAIEIGCFMIETKVLDGKNNTPTALRLLKRKSRPRAIQTSLTFFTF
jgi:hypothetical protein